LERVREGIGDKLSLFLQMLATFIAGFVVGFWFVNSYSNLTKIIGRNIFKKNLGTTGR
jgi:hypothetical protein